MRNKDIIRILTLVKNQYLKNIRLYEKGTLGSPSGLCYAAGTLFHSGRISHSNYEWFMLHLSESFNKHPEDLYFGFIWLVDDKEARINWLDEQIKKHS